MRLIDADLVIDTVNEFKGKNRITDLGIKLVEEIVSNAPTVDAERHGHWIGIDDEPWETYECDKCGYITEDIECNYGIPNNFNYCPNCGAKMDEEVEE